MRREYDHCGQTVEVTVEAYRGGAQHQEQEQGFVAVVRILRAGSSLAFLSPLRFAEPGRPLLATAEEAFEGDVQPAEDFWTICRHAMPAGN